MNTEASEVTAETSETDVQVAHATGPLKILADGTGIPASDPRTDHVAVLFPDGWMVAANLTGDDGDMFDDSDDAVEATCKTTLFGHPDWVNAPLDEVLLRHVIRHDRYNPAVDTNLFPNFPKDGWIRSDVTPWSESSAFFVDLGFGGVNYGLRRSYSGFGLACRRARQ